MSRIGRYEVESELGRGASGVVYLVHDPRVQRPVAAKTFSMPAGLTDDEVRECRERFMREAQAAGNLSHPSIVTIYDVDFDEDRGVPFIAMEYIPGRSLRGVLDQGGPLPLERALAIAASIADALRAAHLAGVIHRDVKPANILVREDDGSAKLADFGVARLSRSELTLSGTTVGSPAYMSPEQLRGQAIDGRSDLFALAAILHEMLTGERAFAGDDLPAVTWAITNAQPAPLAGRVAGVPAELDRFFDRALAKDPAARFQDATAFARALRRAARGESIAAPDAERTERLPAGRRPGDLVAPEAPHSEDAAPDRAGSVRPLIVTAAVLLAIVFGGRWLIGHTRSYLDLEARSSIDDAELTLFVDGDEIWSRRLELPDDATRGRGLARVLRNRHESFETRIAVPAGVHELEARVTPDDGSSDLRGSLVGEFEAGEVRRLRLVAGRTFGTPVSLRLD